MPEPIVCFDLTPEQMEIISPVLALAEIAELHGSKGIIYAHISPIGIADVGFVSTKEVRVAAEVISRIPASEKPIYCYFGDGTRVELDDAVIDDAEKGEPFYVNELEKQAA